MQQIVPCSKNIGLAAVMLIYVEGKNFSGQTFVLSCDGRSTISRVKSLLLHLLYDVGLGGHYFRLKFENQYLKEPLTLQDYRIAEMSVLQMVPVSFGRCVRAKTAGGVPRPTTSLIRPRTSHPHNLPLTLPQRDVGDGSSSVGAQTMKAIRKEVKIFRRREVSLLVLRVMVLIQLVLSFVDFATSYWWSGFVTGSMAILSVLFLPRFVYISGTLGAMGKWDKWKMLIGALIHFVIALFHLGLFLYLLSADLLQHDCYPGSSMSLFHEATTALGCSYHVWLGLVLYPLQALMFVVTCLIALGLRINFKFQAGLLVEPTLIKTKPVCELLEIAREGRTRDKRQVAFELGNIALLGDSGKEEIATGGGFQVLISLVSVEDGVTQEYAVESLAELLSLDCIQNDFIAQGGVAILCALLCSSNLFVVEQAAVAVSSLTPHCSGNRVAIVEENGIHALMKAFHQGSPNIQTLIVKSLLDLAFCPRTLSELCVNSEVVDGMVQVVGRREVGAYEGETKIVALQILDEIGKLQPDVILKKVELIKDLLDSLVYLSHEVRFLLPTIRILTIFARDKNKSKHLLEGGLILKSLEIIISECGTNNKQCPGLQSHVVQIVEVLMQQKVLLTKLLCLGVRDFLERVKQSGNWESGTSQTIMSCLEVLDG